VDGVVQLGRGNRPSLRNLLLTPGNVRRVTEQLAQMRGAAMKVGQLISMDSGDLLPPELADIMARLRSDAHFMPPAQLKKVLNAGWPAGWLREFETFDVRPIAAASIGQVHRARLRDGRDLAIKVQYPGIADSIESDIANVGALIRMSGLLPSGFDLAPYLDEARDQLHEEADYLREGRNLAEFGALLAGDPRYELPRLDEERTTKNVLAMSFVAGIPIEDLDAHSQDTRDAVAARLIELLLRELFTFGRMQTDPNFANFRYNPDTTRIVLLDFGATRRVPPRVSDLYRQLFRAGLDQDELELVAVLTEIGFIAPETRPAHRDQILRMVEMVFAELRGDVARAFLETNLPREIQAHGLALAEDGFIPPPLPIDVLHVQRKLGGIFLLASRLRARVPLEALVRRFVAAGSSAG